MYEFEYHREKYGCMSCVDLKGNKHKKCILYVWRSVYEFEHHTEKYITPAEACEVLPVI